ncbi:hypothetical protein [Paenibacillus tarimensis]|uniref:hypothetical protein n=1 Tax=Paenibacillus tarimensis TaxID=416012 RepID=UPI001F3C0385|nr:hypothetical protein [Paenibacillus tarimensis]MCF2944627.1 hypothetical protein [Paenibacillus tarimensis]
MEIKDAVKGSSNNGPKARQSQPKVVAKMQADEKLKDPKQAAEQDGYPGSCQF